MQRDLQSGGASRDRTDDPLLAKQVLSQLSYGPEIGVLRPVAELSECRLLVRTPVGVAVMLKRR